MTDDELLAILKPRVELLKSQVDAACERVNRDPAEVTIVAVTKTVSPRVAGLMPRLGLPNLGESRPQELWRKAEAIPNATFHLIGHLQRNKLDRTIPLVALMHSADSERMLTALNAFGIEHARPVHVLLEVNISREEAKGGIAIEDLASLYARFHESPGLSIRGLMGMAAYADNPEAARPAFRILRELRDELQQTHGKPLRELSMGMSGDFVPAIEEGATLIRPGSLLFADLPADQ